MSTTTTVAARVVESPPSARLLPGLGHALWVVGSATVAGQIIGVFTSLSLRWLLDPAQLGIWQSLRLFASYGNYCGLGASKGVARELSRASGRGDVASLQGDLDAAHTFNVITAVAYGGLILVGGFTALAINTRPLTSQWQQGLVFLALFVVLQRLVTFQITLLRAEQHFAVTSRQSIAEGAATLLVGGVATWLTGLSGLFCATLLVGVASLIYLQRHARLRLGWSWNVAACRRLIAIGGPILLTGLFTTLFRSLDRLTLLFASTNAEFELGCYSTALLVGNQLYGLASVAGTVTAPQLAQLHGATSDLSAVARSAAATTLWQTTWLAPLGAFAVIVGQPLLSSLFPDYRSGLPALPWLVGSALLLAVAQPATNVLIAVGQERRALTILVVSTALTAAALVGLTFGRVDMVDVAAVSGCGQLIYAVAGLWFGIGRYLSRADRGRFLSDQVVTATTYLSALAFLEYASPFDCDTSPRDLNMLGLKLCVIALVAAGLTWLRRVRALATFDNEVTR